MFFFFLKNIYEVMTTITSMDMEPEGHASSTGMGPNAPTTSMGLEPNASTSNNVTEVQLVACVLLFLCCHLNLFQRIA